MLRRCAPTRFIFPHPTKLLCLEASYACFQPQCASEQWSRRSLGELGAAQSERACPGARRRHWRRADVFPGSVEAHARWRLLDECLLTAAAQPCRQSHHPGFVVVQRAALERRHRKHQARGADHPVHDAMYASGVHWRPTMASAGAGSAGMATLRRFPPSVFATYIASSARRMSSATSSPCSGKLDRPMLGETHRLRSTR